MKPKAPNRRRTPRVESSRWMQGRTWNAARGRVCGQARSRRMRSRGSCRADDGPVDPLRMLPLVPRPADRWAQVLAVLTDFEDLIMLRPTTQAGSVEARQRYAHRPGPGTAARRAAPHGGPRRGRALARGLCHPVRRTPDLNPAAWVHARSARGHRPPDRRPDADQRPPDPRPRHRAGAGPCRCRVPRCGLIAPRSALAA